MADEQQADASSGAGGPPPPSSPGALPQDADTELRGAVEKAYKRKYPHVTAVDVRHIVREMLPGALVVVCCNEAGDNNAGNEWEEMCYVRAGQVQIFDDTESLVRAMLEESRNNETIQELQAHRHSLDRHIAVLRQRSLLVGAAGTGLIALAVYLFVNDLLWPLLAILLACYGLVGLLAVPFLRGSIRRHESTLEELDYRIDLQRYRVDVNEARAEKILRLNDLQLRRYYESTLRQNGHVFWLGILCMLMGVGISAFALWLVGGPWAPTAEAGALGEKIVTGILGAVGALLTNFVAAIYLKMHAEAAKNMVTLHARLVDTHRSLFGNVVASRIKDEKLRWETLSKIALSVAQPSGPRHEAGTP